MFAILRSALPWFFLIGASVPAQVTTAPGQSSAQGEPVALETVPRVPGVAALLRGLNAGVSYSAVHNSSVGWYTVLTPAISYSFSPHYSADASASIYFHRLIDNPNPATAMAERLVVDNESAGDTLVGFHATYLPTALSDTVSAYLGAPTGDRNAGLGTGRFTYDLSNHTERSAGQFAFLLDLGIGNSSNVFNSLVNRNFSSVGALAQFQAGTTVAFSHRSYFEAFAYEQLPLGSQTVYSSVGQPGVPTQQVSSGSAFAEDNGFVTLAGIPLNRHLTLSGYYNRSLRRQTDTVSFGFTYVVRGVGRHEQLSEIDRALREAEKGNP